MTNGPQESHALPWSADDDPDGLVPADFDSRDWALAALLDIAVESNSSNTLSLTVVVAGTLISGEAISRMRWRELFIEQIRTATGNGDRDRVQTLANVMDDLIGGPLDHSEELMKRRYDQRLPRPTSHYLHFQKANVHAGQFLHLPIFRVLIEDISGWALGQLVTNTGPP